MKFFTFIGCCHISTGVKNKIIYFYFEINGETLILNELFFKFK